MNLKDAIKSLNVEDMRPRDRRSHRLDRQTVNSFDKDNRLDRVFEAEDGSDEEFDREVDGQIEDGQMMQEDNIRDVYELLSQGEQMPLQPKRPGPHGFSPVTPEDDQDDMYVGGGDGGPDLISILEALGMGPEQDGMKPTDQGMNYGNRLSQSMRGRDVSMQDLLDVIASPQGDIQLSERPDPQQLIEAAMAQKVTGRMAGDGFFGKKNQSRIGGLDEPRKKIGKGEQRVNRKDAKYNRDGSEATAAEKKDRNASSRYKKKVKDGDSDDRGGRDTDRDGD